MITSWATSWERFLPRSLRGDTGGQVMFAVLLFTVTLVSLLNLVVADTTLYFTATDGVNGVELWKSNGTATGTSMVVDLTAGSASSMRTGTMVVPALGRV